MSETMEAADLVTIEPADALAHFTIDGKIDPILARVRAEIDKFETPDVTTAAGRKEIASFAYRITRAKTTLEAIGKKLADEQKEIPKKIDATRRRVKLTLEDWADEVRRPLTEWEGTEERRIKRIKADLDTLATAANDTTERPSAQLRDILSKIELEDVSEARFEEYAGAAAEFRAQAIVSLVARIDAAEKREAEAAELAALRREKEERDRRDHEERIAREAAERAKAEAEAKAKADLEAAEKRERDLKDAAARAEAEKEAAVKRATEAAAKAKADAEREIAERKAAEDEAQRKREANKAHLKQVNRAALDALVSGGVPEEHAKAALKLIINGKVPNVSILY